MIYTFIPYSVDKNYGEACNEMMDLLPEDGWGCILDHDICFTTYNWYVQLNEIIKKNVNGTYTACCN